MAKSQKVMVSERALMARINRKLKAENQHLRKSKVDSRCYSNLGSFYIVDDYRNSIEASHVDLVELGKELKVLQEFEAIEA